MQVGEGDGMGVVGKVRGDMEGNVYMRICVMRFWESFAWLVVRRWVIL